MKYLINIFWFHVDLYFEKTFQNYLENIWEQYKTQVLSLETSLCE